jgi:hypothetical protein
MARARAGDRRRESVHPLGFVEILRHVDIDLNEDESFKLIGLRSVGEVVHGPVARERRRVLCPGIGEPLLVEEMDVRIDDREIDHAERLLPLETLSVRSFTLCPSA